MGEREQKTVNEFRDINNPDKVLVKHVSDTGEEPVYVNSETLVGETKLSTGQVQQTAVDYKLDELVKDYYMFSLAPVYLSCLWDRNAGRLKFDLLYRFAEELRMKTLPKVVYYRSERPLFYGGAGEWDHMLQGLPREGNLPYIFSKWAEQLVFVERGVRPMQYWRVNRKQIDVLPSAGVAVPVSVDIYLPTGVDRRLDTRVQPDGGQGYIELPPEEWLVEESMRYFGGVDL